MFNLLIYLADVTSIDMDPLGQKMASMDKDGTCCLTDINSDALLYSINTVRVNLAGKGLRQYISSLQ